MSRNVLVIGGSYFAGRIFSILASRRDDWEITIVNRGRFALDLPHTTEYRCDRHDTADLLTLLSDADFDAVVYFCAYEPHDIAPIIEGLGERASQYVYLSTCSLYDPSWGGVKNERCPLLRDYGNGPMSDYIRGKGLLEKELVTACEAVGHPYTIIRPAFIYGPYNYAPRESFFIERIVKDLPVPMPCDSTSRFSFVYVRDLAEALIACVGDDRAFNEVFNAASPEHVDYKALLASLEKAHGAPVQRDEMTIRRIIDEQVPLPFPLVDDELYDGSKLAETFGVSYTSLDDGMKKTYEAFKPVYAG